MRELAWFGALGATAALGAWWLGAEPQQERPAIAVGAADPYLDIIQPLLDLRCSECHNDTDLTGGFSVATYERTLVGGDTARAIVPGNLDASELFYRVSRSPDDDAFMPAEGKPPLTAEQVEILRWWIGAGAPRGITVGTLAPPVDIERFLADELAAKQ